MPKGYETANGTFDPTVNTLFINKEMLQSQPEYEQMFYLFHELRHALQYLHPERFDELISRSRLYVIQYDGTCYKLVDGEWKECKLEGSIEFFTELYLGQPHERDAKEFFSEFSTLDEGQDYAMLFLLSQNKSNHNAFVNTALGMLLSCNPKDPDNKRSLSYNVSDSSDGQNHFWLLKRK